jgi:hypothetical protein
MTARRRRPGLEERLAELVELRRAPDAPENAAKLRQGLARRSNVLAAKAAQLVAEFGLDELTPELLAAFDRFMEKPAETDKGCLAKTAIVKALLELERPAVALFRQGLRHVQMEPSWGPPVDTAIELRANSALGLVNAGYPRAVVELVPLLLDPGLPVRLAAAQGIGASGRAEAEAVLTFKVMAGDEEPEVLAECMAGLLHLEPERSLDFVAAFLDAHGRSELDAARREAAVLALGESRLEEAVPLLRREWDRAGDREGRRLVLLALVATRRDAALDFLLSRVAESDPRRAAEVVGALAVLRHDDNVRRRVRRAVEANAARQDLERAYDEAFS